MEVPLTRRTDYTLSNPDTLTKYKTAATIAEKALKEVSGMYPRNVSCNLPSRSGCCMA
jgi:methionine aminopeptidase